jgi:hypothetical protein
MIEIDESESRTATIAERWEVQRRNSREMSANRNGSRAAPAKVIARRLAIGATRVVGFLDAWGAWHRAKMGEEDIPSGDAPPVECLRPIVGHHLLAVLQPDGAFAYSLVGQALRQLGWPESLRGTQDMGDVTLRTLAEAHCREAVEQREASLYEVTAIRGTFTVAYERLALPFGDREKVRFLLLGISIQAAPARDVRAVLVDR